MKNQDIIIQNLSKSFGDKVVFSNFSARFAHGQKSSIMAASGKGKTTLFKVLLGLETKDGGTITGLETKKIATVFQEDRLCENLSARVNVAIASDASKKSIEEGLCAIGLSQEIDTPIFALSGGMKRRVAIMRALLFDADVILMDEPFKGLDEDTKKKTIELVKNYTVGKTLLLVTHTKDEQQALGTVHNIVL